MAKIKGAGSKRKPTVIAGEIVKEAERVLTAETIPHDGAMMVYHPLLQHLNTGGFYVDPEDCAESLADHCPHVAKRYKVYAFATTPEGCQGLNLDDLIESASQDMYEDWYERVTDDCRAEIAIAQATLNALHLRFQDFPTWRVDYSRVVILPVKESRK